MRSWTRHQRTEKPSTNPVLGLSWQNKRNRRRSVVDRHLGCSNRLQITTVTGVIPKANKVRTHYMETPSYRDILQDHVCYLTRWSDWSQNIVKFACTIHLITQYAVLTMSCITESVPQSWELMQKDVHLDTLVYPDLSDSPGAWGWLYQPNTQILINMHL